MKNIEQLSNLSIKEILNLPEESRVIALEKLIKYHNERYFIDNNPEIPDTDFDLLTIELEKLNPDSPVLYELVGDIGSVEHSTPMLSIEKKYTYEGIAKWVKDTSDTKYLVEPKYDGMAAKYQSGQLSTRGNGLVGEDISARLPLLNVIGKLPEGPEPVYGEVIIPLSYFNENLAGEYKNPRNATVGIVKAKSIKPAGIKALKDGGVHFVLHDQAVTQTVKQEDLLKEDLWEELLEEIFHQDYPLDGVVIKATSQAIKDSLGTTQHHEKWQVAYKSPAERKWSTVKEIKDQVGRTGRITSVAVIDPINLSGATVTNVTLHNFEYVKESGIGVGSKVEVCRSGEVIPFITNVIPADKPHLPRTQCPICSSKLVINGKYLECPNIDCPARLSQTIEYFFKVLGVEELGLKTIEKFINEFKLTSIIDFYDLKVDTIASLDSFGSKSATNITVNINNTLSETITESQLLQALGIKEFGPATSKWILNEHGFDNLPKLTIEDLENVKGIGPTKAQHFLDDIHDKWPIVVNLQEKGLKFKRAKNSDKLKGKSFAITGKKGQYSRDELIEMIEQNGGEYKTSITKDLDYLIAGEEAGSKLVKAEGLGVEVITEEKFMTLFS